jgi:hypothetical protein
LYFQLLNLPEETCFQQAGSSAVEGTSQAVLGSSDQQKVPDSLSLFLKSENFPKDPKLHNLKLISKLYVMVFGFALSYLT